MNNNQEHIEKVERDFHNQWAKDAKNQALTPESAFEPHGCPENVFILEQMGNISGKTILELGSGLGEATLYFAAQGALVTATDISDQMLSNLSKNAQARGLKINLERCSANDLSAFPSNSFDIVYAANLLHHVHIESAITEIHRVLKPSGRFFAFDPLAYNPIINVYRKIATQVRTEDEHPITRQDLSNIRNIFARVQTRFFWLTSLSIFLKFLIIDWVGPNQSRYWKKVLVEAPRFPGTMNFFHKLDQKIFKFLPFLRWWAWNIVIIATKKELTP